MTVIAPAIEITICGDTTGGFFAIIPFHNKMSQLGWFARCVRQLTRTGVDEFAEDPRSQVAKLATPPTVSSPRGGDAAAGYLYPEAIWTKPSVMPGVVKSTATGVWVLG